MLAISALALMTVRLYQYHVEGAVERLESTGMFGDPNDLAAVGCSDGAAFCPRSGVSEGGPSGPTGLRAAVHRDLASGDLGIHNPVARCSP